MARIFNVGKINKEEIKIDIPVVEETETTTTENKSTPTTIHQIKEFISEVWSTETMSVVKTTIIFCISISVFFFTMIGIKSMVPKHPLIIISNFNPSNKEWVVSDSLQEAIDSGKVDVSDITVTFIDHEVTFSDSRIIIEKYETVIEDNKNPQIYSNEYFEELVKKGENTYVRKYITLAEEVEGTGALD